MRARVNFNHFYHNSIIGAVMTSQGDGRADTTRGCLVYTQLLITHYLSREAVAGNTNHGLSLLKYSHVPFICCWVGGDCRQNWCTAALGLQELRPLVHSAWG